MIIKKEDFRVFYLAEAHNENVRFVDIKLSTRTQESKKIYAEMIESLREGQDMIIVADLTRAGHDLINVIQNVNRIVERNLAFVAIDNGISISLNTVKLEPSDLLKTTR